MVLPEFTADLISVQATPALTVERSNGQRTGCRSMDRLAYLRVRTLDGMDRDRRRPVRGGGLTDDDQHVTRY